MLIICNIIASTAEQCFLVHRYYRLSRRTFLTGFSLFMILAQAAAGFAIVVDFISHPEYGRRFSLLAGSVEYCLSAAVDVLIPLLLVYELRQISTTSSHTQSLIRRIIVNAVSTGLFVGVVEMLLLILYWGRTRAIIVACAALGPLYGITVLSNLFVFQRRPCPSTLPTKTCDLTTLDTLQLQQAVYLSSPLTP